LDGDGGLSAGNNANAPLRPSSGIQFELPAGSAAVDGVATAKAAAVAAADAKKGQAAAVRSRRDEQQRVRAQRLSGAQFGLAASESARGKALPSKRGSAAGAGAAAPAGAGAAKGNSSTGGAPVTASKSLR
jgi:hypothetical protein